MSKRLLLAIVLDIFHVQAWQRTGPQKLLTCEKTVTVTEGLSGAVVSRLDFCASDQDSIPGGAEFPIDIQGWVIA